MLESASRVEDLIVVDIVFQAKGVQTKWNSWLLRSVQVLTRLRIVHGVERVVVECQVVLWVIR